MDLKDFPGFLGVTSRGVIAIHADWPAYPEEHGLHLALLWFSIFPAGTEFEAIDDIDRCVLFLARLEKNKDDKYDQKNFHCAVWHEDLLELQSTRLIRGVRAGSQRQHEKVAREKISEYENLFLKGPDGKLEKVVLPPLNQYEAHPRDWPLFPHGSIALTKKGRVAAAEIALALPRSELKPAGYRALAAVESRLFDTAVREACVALETELKRQLGVQLFGHKLVAAYVDHLGKSGRFVESFMRTFRVELRAVFAFVRNDFMHNLRRLDEAACIGTLVRVVKVRNVVDSVGNTFVQRRVKK